MSIQLKVSNSLKSLSDQLATELKGHHSIFEPIYIVTQTDGMNNWLRLQLAQQLGIAANIHFIKPNDAIHKIYRALDGQYQESISSDDLTWLLYMALEEADFVDKYPEIVDYYTVRGHQDTRKRLALAVKMADLFDQYQIYRSDVIKAWNDDIGDDDWQKALWKRTRTMAGDHFPDKTIVSNYILEALKSPEKVNSLQKKLPVLYFFGLSLITHYHIQLISEVAKIIQIQFMMQNPAPEDYWFDDKQEKFLDYMRRKGRITLEDSLLTANPLLVGWGKLIQDTFLMLFEDEDTLNYYEESALIPPKEDNLLHKIQNSIYYNQKDGITFTENDINDGSITINSCYNPIREVEELYNYLVHLADGKPDSLSARDIVVMVSDIDMYASYIRAVFDNAPYRFNYSIADERFVDTDSLANALKNIMEITERDFTSENVLRLLDFSSIRRQFGINDTTAIRNWIDKANIRFGFSGSLADETRYVSWEYGMQRLMYGLCISGGEKYGSGTESFFPLDIVEGSEGIAVTKFMHFVYSLRQSLERRKVARNLTEWVTYIQYLIPYFIGDGEDDQDDSYRQLQQQLSRYNLVADIFNQEISYEVFRDHFMPVLSNARRAHTYASRGITFCSLIPMRSIPFKVVALLGLNFDKFPRQDNRVSFDLMLKNPRKGDRNIKENDKHLMLETLLSAGSHFYISYVGQSVKDNSSIPPTTLVDELVDFISEHSENRDKVRDTFIKKHPLHGYSRKYNHPDTPDLYSYLIQTQDFNNKFNTVPASLPEYITEITVKQLTDFFKNPIKFYYQNTLNVYYKEDDLGLSETEIFDLNHLEKWKLKTLLLETDENVHSSLRDDMVKRGELPLKNRGAIELEDQWEEIAFVRDTLKKMVGSQSATTEQVSVVIGDTVITGEVNQIYGDLLVHYSFSKSEDKHKFIAYLEYLLLTVSNKQVSTVYISNPTEKLFRGITMTKSQAIEQLTILIKMYIEGQKNTLPFDFKFGKQSKLETLNKKEFSNKINKNFDNRDHSDSDLYRLNAWQSGLFEKEEALERYKEAHVIIYGQLERFFAE
jgi:exodeoxyribonuclease V gamma subunit